MRANKLIEITLIMTYEEALWLKLLLQNDYTEEESASDKEMRKNFWEMLVREGV